MPDPVSIRLQPLGETIEVERGTPLRDVLFAYGVEFPCGGHGRCKGCRVRVLDGPFPVDSEQQRILPADEIAAGWRLSCRGRAAADLTLEIAQWEMAILSDESAFEFTPGEGLGVALDLGTTTLVAQLLDLRTGDVLAVQTGLNPQAVFGSDIMSRVELALTSAGRRQLRDSILQGSGALIRSLRARAGISKVAIVGNTVMHHLFCGIDVEPLSHAPFRSTQLDPQLFASRDLGWGLPGDPVVEFLPCVGGFVGSDILAGVFAAKLHESVALEGLLDLGTNGEIVFGNRERLVCASTAAGPAFEGGRIAMGMRASAGAIVEVEIANDRPQCRVLGGGTPRGICGSGLVDAAAAGLELGAILPSGRLPAGSFSLESPVTLSQRDIRELQMAKAAIAAGVQVVLDRLGASQEDVTRVHLAGAFGNYVNHTSAGRIGLLDFPPEKVRPAGNTALLGAKLALFHANLEAARRRMEHISLASDPRFEEIYVESMGFPV